MIPGREFDAEGKKVVAEMLASGQLLCESDTWDSHHATHQGPDGGFYCERHRPAEAS